MNRTHSLSRSSYPLAFHSNFKLRFDAYDSDRRAYGCGFANLSTCYDYEQDEWFLDNVRLEGYYNDAPSVSTSPPSGTQYDDNTNSFSYSAYDNDGLSQVYAGLQRWTGSTWATVRTSNSGSLSGTSYSNSVSRYNYDIAPGYYRSYVYARDDFGRYSGTAYSSSTYIYDDDTSGPTFSYNGTANQSDGANNIVNWSASDASGIYTKTAYVQQYTGSWTTIASTTSNSVDLNGYGLGTFRLYLTATDNDYDGARSADRASSYLYTNSFTIYDDDTSGPSIIFSNAVNQNDSQDNIVGWDITDPSPNSGIWSRTVLLYSGSGTGGSILFSDTSSNTGSFNLNSLSPGTYTIWAKATDNDTDLGSVDRLTTTTSRVFTISDDDTSGPSITLGGSSGTESHGVTQAFSWNIADPSGVGSRSVTILKNGSTIHNSSALISGFNFDSFGIGTFVMQVSAADLDNDRSGDSLSSSASRSVVVTNDAPVISVVGDDSDAQTLTETNAGLSSSGTLSVEDVDTTDTVVGTVESVTVTGDDGGLGNAALLVMMSVVANPVIDNANTTGSIKWSFDSGSEAFDHLAVGESLALAYKLRAKDSQSAIDDHTVQIKITGTNDQPDDRGGGCGWCGDRRRLRSHAQ